MLELLLRRLFASGRTLRSRRRALVVCVPRRVGGSSFLVARALVILPTAMVLVCGGGLPTAAGLWTRAASALGHAGLGRGAIPTQHYGGPPVAFVIRSAHGGRDCSAFPVGPKGVACKIVYFLPGRR